MILVKEFTNKEYFGKEGRYSIKSLSEIINNWILKNNIQVQNIQFINCSKLHNVGQAGVTEYVQTTAFITYQVSNEEFQKQKRELIKEENQQRIDNDIWDSIL